MLSRDQIKIILYGLTFLLIAGLGFYGFHLAFPSESLSNIAYYTLQLFALQPPSADHEINFALNLARFGAPLLLAGSTIGLFLYASGRGARGWFGRGFRDHLIIFGQDDLAVRQALSSREREEARDVVLVVDGIGDEVVASLEKKGINVYPLSGNLLHILKKIKTKRAGMILLMLESEDQRLHLKKLLSAELGTESDCLVFVRGTEDQDEDLVDGKGKTVQEVLEAEALRPHTRWVYFDPYELAAQKILTDFGPHLFVPQRIELESERPHIVIFGLGTLAQAWMKAALANCHFRSEEKIRMTVFYDQGPESEIAQSYRKILGQKEMRGSRLEKVNRCRESSYQDVPREEFLASAELHAGRYFDLHFEGVSFADLDSDLIEDVLKSRLQAGEKAVVYLAHSQDAMTLRTARVLDGDYRNLDHLIAKCVICIQEVKASSRHLQILGGNSDFMMIFPIEEVFQGPESLNRLGDIEERASKLHMSYLKSPDSLREPYGERAFRLWSELPQDKKKSNRSAVLHFFVKASLFGYSDSRHWDFDKLEEVFRKYESQLARLEHQRWEAFHFVEGWRLGERLDKDKTHPSLVPFDWLSQQQKDRDVEQIYAALKMM
ncbi:MAG: hypothetical protein KF789_05565 [Bdellovibrionaceae bacterium]|nr:hypothetical protein [Pseudobdellovibrionaceae bacterium]